MSIPIYSLSCYVIPDSILDMKSKLARQFLWGRGIVGGSFNPMNWNTSTPSKAEDGLGIRILRST